MLSEVRMLLNRDEVEACSGQSSTSFGQYAHCAQTDECCVVSPAVIGRLFQLAGGKFGAGTIKTGHKSTVLCPLFHEKRIEMN